MIKEDRVREEYKLALAEERHGKDFINAENYFGFDYISKEVLKSFVSGTFCFIILVALAVLSRLEDILANINSLDYLGIGVTLALYYLAFLLVYLFFTAVVYLYRYIHIFKVSKRYDNHLKRLNKMYAREEKLKL